MKKECVERCLNLTEEILISTYSGDSSIIIEYMHENCLWIGPLGNQYLQGKENIFKNVKEQSKGIPKVYLQSKKFNCISRERNECVITGQFIATTKQNSHELFCDLQRATFVWKIVKDKLQVVHIHISSPQGVVEDNYNFPHQITLQTKAYLDMLIKQKIDKNGTIMIKDHCNIYQVIQVYDIVFCESFDSKTVIHTLENEIIGRIKISKLEAMLKEKNEFFFIRVHKSFIANKYYVNRIQRYELEMRNGTTIPVSKKRYLIIKEILYR